MHNILKGKIVGGVLAALGIAHLSQLLLVQSFCTMTMYTVPRIVAVLMDGWLWHIFYFMLVEKTNLSSLIPLTMVQWYTHVAVEDSPQELVLFSESLLRRLGMVTLMLLSLRILCVLAMCHHVTVTGLYISSNTG